jgi:hypothetical protein
MPQIIHRVQPGLQPIPQKFNPMVLQLVHQTLPFLLRFRTRPWLPAGITQIESTHIETLVEFYRQFQAGKIRFMLAFRHVEVDDPLCGLYLLSRLAPQAAKQQGIKLCYPLHAHFLFDRGMPLWGGEWLGWLLSRLGGVAIHRGKHPDWQALRAARELMINGTLPLAVAPEGATNGHSELLSPLEPGTAQLGFWCVEDLLKAGRFETVWILPIGLQYRYINPSWHRLDQLMSQLEDNFGLSIQPIGNVSESEREAVFYVRLLRLGEHLLTKMEQFYTRYYHRLLAVERSPLTDSTDSSSLLPMRLQTLLHQALQVAEAHFGISSRGTFHERCRRIEEASWTDIYRSDIPEPKKLSPLDRGLADWVAEHASLQVLHMRLVESVVAITGTYVREKPTFERFAETTLLMFDVMARIRGDKLPRRPRLGYRRAHLTIGEPISVSDRWSTYQTSRQAARQAIAELTQDLQHSLEAMLG